jgi:formylglycine-generating enzyme required for sulfatase activity
MNSHLMRRSVMAVWLGVIAMPTLAESDRSVPDMRFVEIPGGTLTRGTSTGNAIARPQQQVTIAPFQLMTTEVTQQQWQAVMGANPSYLKACGPACPIDQVSWNEVQSFIAKLNQLSGQSYRLPSEAEWEYAARAGATSVYAWGDQIGSANANCDASCGDRWESIAPVMSFAPNAWGLYDMHGNVWEWTQDCWRYGYSGAPIDGTARQNGNCDQRVLRGGSWYSDERALELDTRNSVRVTTRGDIGFRLAREKKEAH